MSPLPLQALGLTVPTITFKNPDPPHQKVTCSITDHPPLITDTHWGFVGTMNILHPGSPLAPPAHVRGITRLPWHGKAQMMAMAQYIYKMFEMGVGVLTLQEVPEPGFPNFNAFIDELTRLEKTNQTHLIDVNAIKTQWLKTGTHQFGTTLLYNPQRFTLTQRAKPALNDRAAEYALTHQASGKLISVSNIHGDGAASKQPETANYIDSCPELCLGDANLSCFTTSKDLSILQSAEKATVTIDGQIYALNTYDIIQDKLSRQHDMGFQPDPRKESLLKILSELESKIGQSRQHHSGKALATAKALLKNLKTAFRDFQDNHNHHSAIDTFKAACQQAIDAAKPVLAKDLGWGDYLSNLLKRFYNAVATKLNASKSSLFTIKKAGSLDTVETTEIKLQIQPEEDATRASRRLSPATQASK